MSVEDSTGSNAAAILFELAERASKLFRKSNDDALACGRVLLEARAIAKHGSWSAFLTDAGMSARTAQKYMQVSRFVGNSPTKCALGSHLGIAGTLDFMRASERSMAAWRAACAADPGNGRLITSPPENAFFGLFWCADPEDRAVLAEVAARDFEIDVADVLQAVEAAELPLADEAAAP